MSEKNPKAPAKPAADQNASVDTPAPRHRRAPTPLKLNPTFDAWLENKLHQIFDVASTEPLPPDLVKLLDKIDKAETAKTAEQNPAGEPADKKDQA